MLTDVVDLTTPQGSHARARAGAAHLRRPRAGFMIAVAAVLVLVLGACSVTLGQPTVTATGPGTTVPIKVIRGGDGTTLAEVGISILSKGPYYFVLDTGASISLIDAPLAQQLRLPQTGSTQPVSGVGGVTQVTLVRVASWHVGTLRLPKTTLASASLPDVRRSAGVQGLLGSDILSQFGRVTVDYDAGTLTVYKQIARQETPHNTAMAYRPSTRWRRAA